MSSGLIHWDSSLETPAQVLTEKDLFAIDNKDLFYHNNIVSTAVLQLDAWLKVAVILKQYSFTVFTLLCRHFNKMVFLCFSDSYDPQSDVFISITFLWELQYISFDTESVFVRVIPCSDRTKTYNVEQRIEHGFSFWLVIKLWQ